MDRIKPLYTATATAIGGRNGHTETSDHIVKADLSVPKALLAARADRVLPLRSTFSPPVIPPASVVRSTMLPSSRRSATHRKRK